MGNYFSLETEICVFLSMIQQYRASSAVGKGGEARTKARQWQFFRFKQLRLTAWLPPRLSEWVWRAVPDEM